MFFSEDLGSYKCPAISLPIDPKFPPISFKARNIPLAMRKKVDVAIGKLLDQGVLEPISNPKWSTPIVPIIKQSGKIRLCADYKVTINKAMKNHPFPIPSVNYILANLADGKFFAKIDLAQAYLQLRVDDASAEAETIVTYREAFKVNRVQFGVNVAPGLFQNFIEDLLKGIPGVFPYFDDVLIFAATEEQLCNHLRLVLERLSESGIRANKNKCIFKTKAVECLGFVIEASGIHPSDSKVRAIHEAPRPKNKTELQAFLDSVLVTFNEKLPLILTSDASPYGVGYVLSHLIPDDTEAPIAYDSGTLTSTERNYSQLDKEALSIIAGSKKFHYFLYGPTFTLVADHQPLLELFNKMKLTPDILSQSMLRWSQMLNAYDFTIIRRPGKKKQNADALSRLPIKTPETDFPSPPEMLFIEELHNPPVKADEISQAKLRDPVLFRVLNWALKGWLESAKEFRIFYLKGHELSVHKNCLLWGNRDSYLKYYVEEF
ncbi:Transposon Ty3-I Gag-Pol polyprotein [Araneus ventricosus]|uniref:Transposon Ty3-I Gag-Pol polyprotein n=1 Tax=Araneus ventricosus TaxID=182803 RepID=A0A4Y2S905_ARAVE|nr:Transposon Ty3-I Gag-Pol polyprotein [Araneus ventricosus]